MATSSSSSDPYSRTSIRYAFDIDAKIVTKYQMDGWRGGKALYFWPVTCESYIKGTIAACSS